MANTWLEEKCPFCNTANWFNLGDIEDVTIPDIDICRCHACNQNFMLDDECKFINRYRVAEACSDQEDKDEAEYQTWDEFLKEAYYELGRNNPIDP